jgi:hypothetical protein
MYRRGSSSNIPPYFHVFGRLSREVYYLSIVLLCDADILYMIRVLIATTRQRGICPCPRCLILMSELDRMGTHLDRKYRISRIRTYVLNAVCCARDFVYKLAKPIGGVAVERLLKPQSWVPTVASVSPMLALCVGR